MATVLIDGDCAMCQAFGRQVERHGGDELSVIQIASPVGSTLLADLDHGQRERGVHLIRDDGSRVSGAEAALEIGRVLPGGRLLAWFGARAPRMSEHIYRFVARNRHRIPMPW